MQHIQNSLPKHFIFLRFLLLISSVLLTPLLAFSAESITSEATSTSIAGRIIMVRGNVQAINAQGEVRTLKRRDAIYNHEVVKTGKASKVQIRFIDNALLALKAESQLNIKAYVYASENEEDNKVLMELVTGGFRTLTGKIGKGNKAAYKVYTPVASIGIRGTLFDVHLASDKIIAGVWKGGISLTTPLEEFNLGLEADFDFGEITNSGVFTGLLTPPQIFTPPTPQTKESPNSEKSDISSNEKESLDKSFNQKTHFIAEKNIPSTQENFVENIPTPEEIEKKNTPQKAAKKIVSQGGKLQLDHENPNASKAIEDLVTSLDINIDDITLTQDNTDSGGSNPDTSTPNNPRIGDPDPNISSPITSPDLRISDAEMGQLFTNNSLAILLGNSNKNLAIALKSDGTDETFFLTPSITDDGTKAYETIRRGNAPAVNTNLPLPWSDGVSWGIWQGSNTAPIERYTESNNNQNFTPLEHDLFYMIAQPASPAELSTGITQGTLLFSTDFSFGLGAGQSDFIAKGNSGGITNVEAQFDLSASAGSYAISNINLNIEIGSEHQWNMQAATGKMNEAHILVDNLTGSFFTTATDSSTAASGLLNGLLLAPDPSRTEIDTFAGSFEVFTHDGINRAGGIIILKSGQ